VADHIVIAGLACDITGAILLARALAFESPDEYAQSWERARTMGAMGGLNAAADFAHVRDAVEARVGALLLLAGFLGQAIGDTRSSWNLVAAVLAYFAATVAITGGLLVMRPWRSRREREVFLAQLAVFNSPKAGYRLYSEYLAGFTQRGQTKADLDKWVAEAERRTGRHPWHADLTVAEQDPVDRGRST
jgi:hypothetical protein